MLRLPQAAPWAPPTPGFGEPLSPPPYVFYTDHREDWTEFVARIKDVTRLLPKSVWQLCYVPSFIVSKRHPDQKRGTADLQSLLQNAGVAELRVVEAEDCRIEPREMDFHYLVMISGDGSLG